MISNRPTQFGSAKKGARPRIAAKGRVCEALGCATVLSIYNELLMCSAHEYPRMRQVLHA